MKFGTRKPSRMRLSLGDAAGLSSALLIFAIVFAAGFGWVSNLIGLTECDFEAPYKCEVIRVVGIVPPVGAVVGYLDVGK